MRPWVSVPPHSGDAQSMHTARVKTGGDGLPTMDEIDEKKRIAEEEEKEKDRITPVSRSWTEGMLLVHRLKRKNCCWGNGIWVCN